MEHIDKPPILRGKVFFQIALLALILVVSGRSLLASLDACIRLPQARENAELVSAVVRNVERSTDSDGDYEYNVYIRYRYEGKDYDVLILSGTKDNSWKDRIGQSLSVRINPDRPGELIDSLEKRAENTVLGLGVFNLWLWIAAMPNRKKWTEDNGHGRCFIQQDLKDCVRRRWLWKWGLLTGTELVVCVLIFHNGIPGWNALLGAVLIWLGLKGFKHRRTDLQKISNEEFDIRNDTLTDKYETLNNNCKKKYCLKYTNENGSWRKTVSRQEYQEASIGQVMQGVYLSGEKRPTLILSEGKTEIV